MERFPMTPQGYDDACRKLEHMKNVEMPRVQKALGDARDLGDLSENAEFDAARHELWNLEQQIAELENKVACAEVVDTSKLSLDTAAIGAFIKAEDVASRRPEEFMLVGEGEARKDVDTVSIASPLGGAFVGKKVGETVEVQAPRGLIRYKILEIRYGL